MKRPKDQGDALGTASQEDMDVDDEEGDSEDGSAVDDDGAGEREDPVPTGNTDSNAFFDTFYGLSSTDPRERSQAAKEMLEHCLVGPSANVKDASYALKRLLNGVCSGRAAARQGNASALAMFLKLSLAQGTLRDIQKTSTSRKELELPILAYVRHRLLEATEPGTGSGKRKPSEDRDHKFGRLFGILGVVRSGILLPGGNDRRDVDEILESATGFVNDLAELYAYKKWMREPAAHAISTLLSSYYALSSDKSDTQVIVDHLVSQVIVPRLLMTGDNGTSALETYSAEQIAIAVHIQTFADMHKGPFMKPLNKPVLTPQSVPLLVASLCETSSVTHPRIHLFWDQFISYITEPVDEYKTVQIRKLRQTCPLSDANPIDLIDSILRHVLIAGLLGVEEGEDSTKTTHEKSALGLSIIRNLSGVEFVSSITGRTRLLLDATTIESVVLQPAIVKYLFLNVLSAGSGGRKKQSAHLLRPLAHQVLDSLIDSIGDDNDDDSTARRLAIIRPLLLCDSRFDSKTKTNFIDRLVKLPTDEPDVTPELWDEYLAFLEAQLLKADSAEIREVTRISQYEAQGYADLLFNFGRAFLHVKDGSQKSEFKETRVRLLLGFLLVTSFYKCDSLEPRSSKKPKNKKTAKPSPVIEAACFVKNHRRDWGHLPYQLRSTLSSRFFSLIAEAVASMMHSTIDTKEEAVLRFLKFFNSSCGDLEAAGAEKLFSQEDMNGGSHISDIESPEAILEFLQQEASKDIIGAQNKRLHRFKTACAILGTVLYLYLLDCGPHDSWDDDDIDEDAENDAVEIREYLSDLKEILLLSSEKRKKDDRDPILAMAEFCTAIMSSPVAAGSQSKGGFPRLLRETMKVAWTSVLNLMAEANDETVLHNDVLPILLRSIGVHDVDRMDVDDDEESTDESGVDVDAFGESDDSVDQPTNEHESSFVDDQGKVPDLDRAQASDDDSDEVGINPDRLRSFFEEESDADIDESELEHHEGADAALAKLIQIKQEARKAGQMARERAEISQQLRCLTFLETILNGKTDGWGALLRTDYILPIIYPLLCHRRELENSLLKAAGKIDEKRSMLEKITSLLKSKIYKIKFSDRWIDGKSSGNAKTCTVLASKIIDQMKGKASKEQRACCSLALAIVVRSASDPLERIEVASIYGDIVREWSTKRTTRLESSVFDDLIQLSPVIAQASLCAPLSTALSNARSLYLKTEAARLLSLLFNVNLNQKNTLLEKKCFESLIMSLEPSLEAFGTALQDPETKKSKRGKEILKALAKISNFALSTSTTISSKVLNNIKKGVTQLQTETESQQLEAECTKLLSLMDRLCTTRHKHSAPTSDAEENPAGDDESGEDVDTENIKKTKNKKKGKKKRK